MTTHSVKNGAMDVKDLLFSYFPDTKLIDKELLEKQIHAGEILSKPDQILPYLQTVFFEEHLLELQLDQSTRIFFTNILDETPGLEEAKDGDGNKIVIDSDYEIGSYLKETDSFLIAPLTPGIGNVRIRACKKVVVRFYTGTTSVELGCTFRTMETQGNNPILRLNFPEVCWINRNCRNFRVKVVWGVDAKIRITQSQNTANIQERLYRLDDVSAMGLAFQVPNEKLHFEVGEEIRFTVKVTGISDLEIGGTIRQTRKVRDIKGYKNICGVQFDLESRSLAAQIEQMAAAIQRLQLREIANKTSFLRGVRIIK